jgi:histidinol dehydrogenase
VQYVSREGMRQIGTAAVTLARAEGLLAHAASIAIRTDGVRSIEPPRGRRR